MKDPEEFYDSEESTFEYYEEQDNLEIVREWFKNSRDFRKQEAKRLELELKEVEADIENFTKELQMYRQAAPERWFAIWNKSPNRKELDVERLYQNLRGRRNDILRQLRNLIRWDREDLQWIGRLEGRNNANERVKRIDQVEIQNEYKRQTETRIPTVQKKNRQHRKRGPRKQTNAPKVMEELTQRNIPER